MDLRSILGVSPDASAEEIKRAYRSCLRMYHPDSKTGGDRHKFQALQEMDLDEVQNDVKVEANHFELRQMSRNAAPEESKAPENFNLNSFNQRFVDSRTPDDWVYHVPNDEDISRSKSLEEYRRGSSEISGVLSSVSRVFGGNFNANTFNRVFQHQRQQQPQPRHLVQYQGEPEPAGCRSLSFSDAFRPNGNPGENSAATKLGYQDWQSHAQEPNNPGPEVLHVNLPEIQNDAPMSQAEAQRMINERNQMKFETHSQETERELKFGVNSDRNLGTAEFPKFRAAPKSSERNSGLSNHYGRHPLRDGGCNEHKGSRASTHEVPRKIRSHRRDVSSSGSQSANPPERSRDSSLLAKKASTVAGDTARVRQMSFSGENALRKSAEEVRPRRARTGEHKQN
ncbi:MAG: J domain-containing protein [Sulfobacillus sp.]